MIPNIPPDFIPLVIIGELDGYLMVYTAETHDNTVNILHTTLTVIEEEGKDNQMTMQ
jgi:hypothetical protein